MKRSSAHEAVHVGKQHEVEGSHEKFKKVLLPVLSPLLPPVPVPVRVPVMLPVLLLKGAKRAPSPSRPGPARSGVQAEPSRAEPTDRPRARACWRGSNQAAKRAATTRPNGSGRRYSH